jgi:hypothetical protein
MGWANSIPRPCIFIDLLVAVFALTACGKNGGQGWVSNNAYKDGEWNLENLAQKLTLGIAERVLDD